MSIPALDLIVAHGSDDILQKIIDGVEDRHTVRCRCTSVYEMKKQAAELKPEMIVTGVTFQDGSGIDAVIEIGEQQPTPTVIVTPKRSLDLVEKAMEDHVMAYLVSPFNVEDLQASMIVAYTRHEQFQELAEEVQDLRQALADRKLIERAKGMLMAAEGVTEAEAFGRLRGRSQDQRVRMSQVAQQIIDDMS
jgi:response regulator NasT